MITPDAASPVTHYDFDRDRRHRLRGALEPGPHSPAPNNTAAYTLELEGATAELIGVVDLKTGVVTHADSTPGSPKGRLFVPRPSG